MSTTVAKLVACGALVVALIASIVGGLLYVRAVSAERDTAVQRAEEARRGIAQRDDTIRQLQQDAADKAKQQAQLDAALVRVRKTVSAIQTETRRIFDESPDARAWADTPLPDGIARLQSGAARTGADDPGAAVPASDAVHVAGSGASHER